MFAMRMVIVVVVIVSMVMPMIVAAVLIVHMRLFFFQKVGIDVELGIQIKPTQIKHLGQRDFAKMHHLLW